MKKILMIILVLICGTAGFLYYDWHVKTKKLAAEPSIILYSWTDEKGKKHFTDTHPPQNAENVEKLKGYEHIEPPLIKKLKYKIIDFYTWLKGKLFKKKENNLTSYIRFWHWNIEKNSPIKFLYHHMHNNIFQAPNIKEA